jgi:hypothetical protein
MYFRSGFNWIAIVCHLSFSALVESASECSVFVSAAIEVLRFFRCIEEWWVLAVDFPTDTECGVLVPPVVAIAAATLRFIGEMSSIKLLRDVG